MTPEQLERALQDLYESAMDGSASTLNAMRDAFELGRRAGLEQGANTAQERALRHEGAALRCDESDVDLTQEAYLHRKFSEVARDIERDLRALAEVKP